eukprot:CAMPEP_0203880596 /NCGR_PEP_ID=MMETSP0359-20131031/24988_1 /ASSEMBLY_ACC=CAM_ASM_000338 /TAXON_ID=268821 /ORGANISM="Scrippsiella Hangoei, Strain SHTV-5" /LENGTH=352 /DNA_ID=CAMNT_0050800245 /DNA_START=8 /DNA_END=1066 /DNA_ORIENTATION=+
MEPLMKRARFCACKPLVCTNSLCNVDGHAYVDYRPSLECPVVLSVPHGGNLTPEAMPDRSSGCVEPDGESWELAEAVLRACSEAALGAPAMVGLKLHRSKLDGNKCLCAACENCEECEDCEVMVGDAADAWTVYHKRIEEALQQCVAKFGFALLLDLHGQSHRDGVTELGYLLYSEDYFLSDAALSSRPPRLTSLDALVRQSRASVDLAAVLRGPDSFGALMEVRGCPCTPSPSRPQPVSQAALRAARSAHLDMSAALGPPPEAARAATYFSGGFTTIRYAAPARVGPKQDPLTKEAQEGWASKVAGVQLETAWAGVRDSDDSKRNFGVAMQGSVAAFLGRWYGWTPVAPEE